MEHDAAAVQDNGLADWASSHLRALTDLWHNSSDKKSVCLHQRTLVSQATLAVITFYVKMPQQAN